MAAFEAAVRDGYDGFECDVRVAADGVLVVVHAAPDARPAGPRARPVVGAPRRPLRSHRRRGAACLWLVSLTSRRTPKDAFAPSERPRTVTFSCGEDVRASRGNVDYEFPVPTTRGVAYDGSAANVRCIERALRAGVAVNLFAPDKRRRSRMVRTYAGRVHSFTL